MEKRFLGIREASEYLGLSVNTLYAWCCMKKIPHIKMGRLTKFDVQRLDKWSVEKAVEPHSMY